MVTHSPAVKTKMQKPRTVMQLSENGKIIEPKVGDAELIRLDFDHEGITVHIKLTGSGSEGQMFFLRIVNPRWFSFCTDLG
jgi:hypothetical protein